MKNRELVNRKLEIIDAELRNLYYCITRENRDKCVEVLESVKEKVTEVSDIINREPLSPSEGGGLY
jgi:hypothetical protein